MTESWVFVAEEIEVLFLLLFCQVEEIFKLACWFDVEAGCRVHRVWSGIAYWGTGCYSIVGNIEEHVQFCDRVLFGMLDLTSEPAAAPNIVLICVVVPARKFFVR